MSENEIRVLYVQPGKYPEERTIPNALRALQELVGMVHRHGPLLTPLSPRRNLYSPAYSVGQRPTGKVS